MDHGNLIIHIFDKYVQLAMSMGIDKAITVYTPVPGGYRFRYMDEKTGNDIICFLAARLKRV